MRRKFCGASTGGAKKIFYNAKKILGCKYGEEPKKLLHCEAKFIMRSKVYYAKKILECEYGGAKKHFYNAKKNFYNAFNGFQIILK